MLGGDMKIGECYQIGMCSLACPKGLNPRAALKHLKDMYAEFDEKKVEQQSTFWEFYLQKLENFSTLRNE